MLLALDVGNTNTVLGLYQAKALTGAPAEVVANWRHHDIDRTTRWMSLAFCCANLFALRGLETSVVTGIAISSVVPPLDSMLRKVCETLFQVKPLFIEPGVKTGLPILTDNPSGGRRRPHRELRRRIRASLAGPTIVVDMGTATTFDVISKKGEFLGGAIAPGLGISAECALRTRCTAATYRYQETGEGHRHEHRRQHSDRPVLRLHWAGRWHPRADDRRAGAGDEDGGDGWFGEADCRRIEVHRRGGRHADAERPANHL